MIGRYTRPEMGELWSDDRRDALWLEIELRALEAMSGEGTVPQNAGAAVRRTATLNRARAEELEKEVKHDVISFLTSVAEAASPEARFLHRGMTSSDLIDTALAVQLREAGLLILRELGELLETLRARVVEFKRTPCIGRSHGIHAEPTTFGIKLASWFAELARRYQLIEHAVHTISVGKIAGAVGTYASVSPQVEDAVLSSLNLAPETVPTQIVHRDRHAEFFSSLALLGSSIERICVEIRHLQRTEVSEVEEGFEKGQKGSSAMPHKKNPIGAENLTGIARLLRGYALAAMENVALWHERDISHSSVERVIAPDACVVADFSLGRLHQLIKNLVVFPEKMRSNLELTKGLIFSGSLLIRLTDKGVSREEAYALVQRNALQSWQGNETFQERVGRDEQILRVLTQDDLAELFSLDRHLRHVDLIVDRALATFPIR